MTSNESSASLIRREDWPRKLRLPELYFGVVDGEGIKNQAIGALSVLHTKGTDKPILMEDIHELVGSLARHVDLYNDEQDNS